MFTLTVILERLDQSVLATLARGVLVLGVVWFRHVSGRGVPHTHTRPKGWPPECSLAWDWP